MTKTCVKSLLTVALLVGVASKASATETILKFGLAEAGADVGFDGTVFGTLSDGNAGTPGDQDTRLEFTGALNFIPDISTPDASFSLDNVLAAGPAQVLGVVVTQLTTGGVFSVWDASNTLLLSGTLNNGVISGSTTDSTGSFFNTTFATFTGGTLAALFDPNSAGLSLALASIHSGANVGFATTPAGPNQTLNPFTGDATGLIEGTAAVPEPVTGMLLLSGLAAGASVRRRMKQ